MNRERPSWKEEAFDSHGWVVFAAMAATYFFVYFHRVSTSVIAPDLLATFHTNATALGFMSSMYFYPYGLEQPLVGHLSDRLGPRRVVGIWFIVAALGCFLFGAAPTIGWACVGRGLIGLGVGGVYVPAMKAMDLWFPKKAYGAMIGLIMASGNLGAIVATTPLAWMAREFGWRLSFSAIGAVSLLLALFVLILTRDHSSAIEFTVKQTNPADEAVRSHGLGAVHVIATTRFWVFTTLFFGVFGSYITFQGLWAAPLFMATLELDAVYASKLVMLVPIGFILGAPLSGWFTDKVFGDRISVFIALLVLMIGMWVCVVRGSEAMGITGMIPALFVMGGAMGGVATTLWALVRDTTATRILGLTTGLLNPSPLLGTAILQGLTGAIVDRVGRVGGAYPPEAYKSALDVCIAITAGCLVISWLFRRALMMKLE